MPDFNAPPVRAKRPRIAPIEPAALAALLENSNCPVDLAARYCQSSPSMVRQWLNGTRLMPHGAGEILALRISMHLVQPGEWMRQWCAPDLCELMGLAPETG